MSEVPLYPFRNLFLSEQVMSSIICSTGDELDARKVDVRLPGRGNSNSCSARPIHLTITMIKWIRTSALSIKKCLSMSSTIYPFP